MATIAYAVFGIPLMLVFLTSMGGFLARGFRCLYRQCTCSSDGSSTAASPSAEHPHHAVHHSHAHNHMNNVHDHYHVHHIALNDMNAMNSTGHVAAVHNVCNSNSNPYGTMKQPCYGSASGCNSTAVPTQYVDGVETKLCPTAVEVITEPIHNCVGTLGRHHSHGTLLRGDHHHHHPMDYVNATGAVNALGQNSYHQQQPMAPPQQLAIAAPRPEARAEPQVPLLVCVMVVSVYVFLGALLFHSWEGWSLLDGAYFSFVTLSTIGFGDLVPGKSVLATGSTKKLIICSLYLLFGMALIAMCVNLVQEQVLRRLRNCGRWIGLVRDDDDESTDKNTSAAHAATHGTQLNDDDFDV